MPEPHGVPSFFSTTKRTVEEHRHNAWNYLINLGKRLGVDKHAQAIPTALVYYHRFFAQESYDTYDSYLVATTALFLACKVEDCSRQLDRVITTGYELRRNVRFTEESPLYAEFKQKLLEYRECVLRVEKAMVIILEFNFTVVHPYRDATRMVRKLIQEYPDFVQHKKKIEEMAFHFINDSFKTTLCLRHPHEEIGIAAVYIGCKYLRLTSLKIESLTKPGITDDTINRVANEILDIYDKSQKPAASQQQTSESQGQSLPFELSQDPPANHSQQ